MNAKDLLIYQALAGETSSSPAPAPSVTVAPLEVTENGEYTAPEGTAYSPVTVNVPTVAVESLEVTENGEYIPPTGVAYSPVAVNVPTGEVHFPTITVTASPTSKNCRIQNCNAVDGWVAMNEIDVSAGQTVEVNVPESIGAWIVIKAGNSNWNLTVTQSGSAADWRIIQRTAYEVLLYVDYQRTYTVHAE